MPSQENSTPGGLRAEGFYWVLWHLEPGTPQIAEWSSRGRFVLSWYLTGWDYPEPDDRIHVIDGPLPPPPLP